MKYHSMTTMPNAESYLLSLNKARKDLTMKDKKLYSNAMISISGFKEWLFAFIICPNIGKMKKIR